MQLKGQSYNLLYGLQFLLFSCAFLTSSAQSTFPCDGSIFISLNTGAAPTITQRVLYDGVNASFDTIMVTDLLVNSTGFNPRDNYIYAINRTNTEIVRLFADGGYEVVGMEPSLAIWKSGGGDCSRDGIFAAHSSASDRIYFYNVIGAFSLDSSVEIYWDPASGNTGLCDLRIDEIVFDPENPNIIYSYQRNYQTGTEPVQTQGALLKIDADKTSSTFGMVSVVGIIPVSVVRHLGAMFFDPYGNLFGYGSPTFGPVVQNTLIAIDKNTGNATPVGIGPGATGNDGCSCPFSVELQKEVLAVDVQCNITTVAYEFSIINNSFADVSNVNFIDQLPFNGTVKSILPNNPLGGTIGAGSGIGTSSVVFNDVTLPAKEFITFQVQIEMSSQAGTFQNQANLTGLPNSLSGVVVSDDPSTFITDDVTLFTIQENDIPEPAATIFGTICANEFYDLNGELFNTAGIHEQILPSGSALGCDSTITLNLTVIEDAEESIAVEICSGSFYVIHDTLFSTPGFHTVIIPSAAVNGCDSTVLLNLTISDTLTHNESYVVCPGDSIIIDGQVYTETGEYELFYPSIGIDDCDSLVVLNVLVEEDLDVDINANPIYCLGDEFGSIEVSENANTTGSFMVALNDGPFQESGTFSNLQAGSYTVSVEMENGCISLYEDIDIEDNSQAFYLFAQSTDVEIDLGEKVFLNVESNFPITEINWSPASYLSCTDCPNPIAQPVDDINYTATAINEDGCEAEVLFSIKIKNRSQIYIPNAFSPNGDGINDLITVFASEGVEIVEEFRIFDRWGEEVFYAKDFPPNELSFGWDGTLAGKLMQPAVFAYYARVNRIDGVKELRKGDITLIR